MRVFLSLFFIDAHPALAASVVSITLVCLMFHYVHTLNHFSTIHTWHEDVWARGLVHLNILPQTLRLANSESLALYWLVIAELIVVLDFLVTEYCITAELFVFTHEFHRL